MNQRGFTFIEVLVAIAITGIVSVALGKLFSLGLSIYQTESNRALAQQILCQGMAAIISDLRISEQNSINVIIDKSTSEYFYKLEMMYPSPNRRKCAYYKAAALLYQQISGTSNQLMYNVNKFELSLDDDVISITIGVKIPGNNGCELELTNSYKIRT